MNQIIKSFLVAHKAEYNLKCKDEDAFEHFINRIIGNKYSAERFDPMDITTPPGEVGIDGIAIFINDMLITDKDNLSKAKEISSNYEVRFVFTQAKTCESFDGSDISNFVYGVKNFFIDDSKRTKTNDFIENLIDIRKEIYLDSLNIKSMTIDMYYACCGKWTDDPSLSDRIKIEPEGLNEFGDFSRVTIFPYDTNKIIAAYKELKKKNSREIVLEKRFPFPSMLGVHQAFTGLLKLSEYIKLLQDSEGNILTNIFEDNVRDFQGYNPVNKEIQASLKNREHLNRFSVLNNGITIVAKNIKVLGDVFEVFDYQIVNGCQTSHVIFQNKEYINDDAYVIIKLIEINDPKILDEVIYTTNRQTEVRSEAFASSSIFHKTLEDYYNSISDEYRLYYERRSKQYDMNDDVNKSRVITLSTQTYSYLAVFLNEPQSTNRYYGEVLKSYKNRLYKNDDFPDTYYLAAYLTYFASQTIKNDNNIKKYYKYRYHIACLLKVLLTTDSVYYGNNRKLKTIISELYSSIRNEGKMMRVFQTAINCIDEAIVVSTDLNPKEFHRSKKFTSNLMNIAARFLESKRNRDLLSKNDVVSCIITGFNQSFVYVELNVGDSRNIGAVHISQIKREYVESIHEEVKVGNQVKVKIIGDEYDDKYGWKLSMIV